MGEHLEPLYEATIAAIGVEYWRENQEALLLNEARILTAKIRKTFGEFNDTTPPTKVMAELSPLVFRTQILLDGINATSAVLARRNIALGQELEVQANTFAEVQLQLESTVKIFTSAFSA